LRGSYEGFTFRGGYFSGRTSSTSSPKILLGSLAAQGVLPLASPGVKNCLFKVDHF
jgi:hypothetical protein